MDSVKQSAALCLLRLYRTSPDLVPMGDWTSRVVHLLNDQHLVNQLSYSSLVYSVYEFISLEFFHQVGCCCFKTRVKRQKKFFHKLLYILIFIQTVLALNIVGA